MQRSTREFAEAVFPIVLAIVVFAGFVAYGHHERRPQYRRVVPPDVPGWTDTMLDTEVEAEWGRNR